MYEKTADLMFPLFKNRYFCGSEEIEDFIILKFKDSNHLVGVIFVPINEKNLVRSRYYNMRLSRSETPPSWFENLVATVEGLIEERDRLRRIFV